MSIEFKEVEHVYSPDTPFAYYALKGVSLQIKDGNMTALIGHTGSGKSTLIQHINALLLPTKGEVKIDDYLITATDKPQSLRRLRQKAGLVFQFPEYQLFEETILKDIIFGPKNFGLSEEESIAVAKEVIKTVGLDESFFEKSPFDLSGGQKRRIAIAGILAMNPDILILDEPTAGLDPQGAKEMMNLFKKINQSGKTVILVTHDMNHVLEYCDDVIVMNKGKIEKHEDVDTLFKNPEYLQSLGIDLPVLTSFIMELNKEGFQIDPNIKDVNTLIDQLGGCLHE